MSKDTLKSLSSVALAASSQAKTEAQAKIAVLKPETPVARAKPVKAKRPQAKAVPTDAANGRLNLYLNDTDKTHLKNLRKIIVAATGEAASSNVIVRAAMQVADPAKIAEVAAQIIATDGRRKEMRNPT